MNEITQLVLNGEKDALLAYIELKSIEKEVKASLEKIKDLAIAEAEKFGEKSFKAFGAKVELRNSAGRWDFKHLEWYRHGKHQEDLAKESFNANKKGMTYSNEDGEVIEPAKFNPGKLTIAIT